MKYEDLKIGMKVRDASWYGDKPLTIEWIGKPEGDGKIIIGGTDELGKSYCSNYNLESIEEVKEIEYLYECIYYDEDLDEYYLSGCLQTEEDLCSKNLKYKLLRKFHPETLELVE